MDILARLSATVTSMLPAQRMAPSVSVTWASTANDAIESAKVEALARIAFKAVLSV